MRILTTSDLAYISGGDDGSCGSDGSCGNDGDGGAFAEGLDFIMENPFLAAFAEAFNAVIDGVNSGSLGAADASGYNSMGDFGY